MNSKNKIYTSAPLPFMGQKRKLLKCFKNALKEYPSNAVYVDLFGGSGLLSHTVKQVHQNATVIYNDYDNYYQRISNIDKTNRLIADLRIIIKGVPVKKRITDAHRNDILDRISLEDEKGYVDYNRQNETYTKNRTKRTQKKHNILIDNTTKYSSF